MSLTLTIDGATKVPQVGSLYIAMTANGRATAAFAVKSEDASYRPQMDDEVIFVEDATRIFGGLIDRPRERGIAGGARAGILTDISAVDFNAYTERRYVNETLAAGTLKSMLTTLVNNYLDDYGVSLDAGQADGPSLPDLTFEYVKVTDVLNQLMTLTAEAGEPYAWRIDAFKVLQATQPSTVPAPFNISGSPISQILGDLVVEETRQGYANRVIVTMPAKTEYQHVETFTGDGSTDTFTLQYQLFAHRGYVTADGIFETFTSVPGDVATWTYNPANNTITRTTGAPGNGDIITIEFDGTFSGSGLAEDAGEIAANGVYEAVVSVESLPSDTTAQAVAEAEIARRVVRKRTIQYRTLAPGVLPGQSQTVTVAWRNLSAEDAVITDVVIRDLGDRDFQLVRDVTAVIDASQTNLGRGWRDVYKLWAGGGRSSVGITAAGIGGGTGVSGVATDQYVYKTADETVNGSAAFQDDDHLLFSVEANAVYWVWMVLYTTAANTTPNFKVQWTYPTSTTIKWGNFEGTTNYWGATGVATGNLGVLTESQSFAFGGTGAAGNPRAVTIAAQVTVGATAGTVRLQWAQNTSTGVDCTIHQGSWLRYRKIYQ